MTPPILFNVACALDESVMGFPTWYKYLEGTEDKATGICMPLGTQTFDINNPNSLSKINSLAGIGLAIIEILLRIVVMVAVAFVAYGGFKYLISQGEPGEVQAAKNTILNAFIGLVIAMLATGLVNFIGNTIK